MHSHMSLPTTRRIPPAYASIVVRLRWPIVAASPAVAAGAREGGPPAPPALASPCPCPPGPQTGGATRLRGGGGHVTGILPAEVHEGGLVDDALPLIEAATVVLLALLVGVRFRALGAPLLTLAAVGTAYTLAEQAVSHAARRAGLEQPSLLRPLLVALVLGLVTDYVVFYLSHAQTKTLVGSSRLEAAQQATAETTPIVIAGGAILTASLLALPVARTEGLQQLGPALALAVAVAVLAAVTLVPAPLAIPGRALY